MSANYHTDVSAGAAATAATVNSPLGQLDAKINPTYVQATGNTEVSTTVTTASTYYACAGMEAVFTPAYTGQVFLFSAVLGTVYADTAGGTTIDFRLVDGANATVSGLYFVGHTNAATTFGASQTVAGSAYWTAGAGDVGVTRKLKVYATHSVNGSVVKVNYWRVSVGWH